MNAFYLKKRTKQKYFKEMLMFERGRTFFKQNFS